MLNACLTQWMRRAGSSGFSRTPLARDSLIFGSSFGSNPFLSRNTGTFGK